jgi:Tfp pilus assembly PilM family ATPase
MLGNNSINKFVYATTKELKGIVVKKQNTEIKILENISIPLDEGVFINGKVTKKDEFINSLELLKVSSQSFQNNIIFILDNSSIIFKKVEIPSKFNSKDLNNLAQLEFADLQDNNAREMIYSTSVVNSQHGKFGLCTAVERNLILEIRNVLKLQTSS